jgi:hypothetical protein
MGAWTYTFTNDDLMILGEGSSKSITAYAVDAAGNRSIDSTSFSFSVFTASPLAPQILSAGGPDSVISSLAGDNVVIGSAMAGCDIELYGNNILLGKTTTNSDGTWSCALTAANLANIIQVDTTTLTALAINPLGQKSDDSTPVDVLIDTVRPTVSSVGFQTVDGATSGTLNQGDDLLAMVSLSETVQVIGTPTLKMHFGSSIVEANYDESLSTETELGFRYHLPSGEVDISSIRTAPNALAIRNGASVKDLAGNLLAPYNLDYTNEAFSNANPRFDIITGLVLDDSAGDRLNIDAVGTLTTATLLTSISGISKADTVEEINNLFKSTLGAASTRFTGGGNATALLTSNLDGSRQLIIDVDGNGAFTPADLMMDVTGLIATGFSPQNFF